MKNKLGYSLRDKRYRYINMKENHMSYDRPKFFKRHLLIFLFALTGCKSGSCDKETAGATKQYDYTWESLKTHPVPDWFSDAKFGIFVVWGPYSVPAWRAGESGYAEWFPCRMYTGPNKYYPFVKERFGANPPEFGYKDICRRFEARNFDPENWAALFKQSGAKYVIQIAEFHAGFAMWDSKLTDWCATKVGPKRDIVGEVGEAVRKQGMKYGVSTHRERHPGFFTKERYAIKSTPHKDIIEEMRRDPSAAELYGPFEYSDAFIADYVARWKELQDQYKPDFMWVDDIPIYYKDRSPEAQVQIKTFQDATKRMIADYFNAANEWGEQVYLNNKGGHPNWPVSLGARSRDNMNMKSIPKEPWENPATMSTSYGFCEKEETGDSYRSIQELIQLLCDVVSKNGTLLLTVGPKGDGTIPQRQQERLLAIGDWLKVNGEAIYGTRPWIQFGEGEGESVCLRRHSVPIRDKEIRYTQKDQTLYVLSLNKPVLPLMLTATKRYQQADIRNITLLGSDQEIIWHMTDRGISIDSPSDMEGEHVWAFRIDRMPSRSS
jgi:alpha-L-fucosidase